MLVEHGVFGDCRDNPDHLFLCLSQLVTCRVNALVFKEISEVVCLADEETAIC